jgi:hypothetical protein
MIERVSASPILQTPNDKAVQEGNLYATAYLMRAVHSGADSSRILSNTVAFPSPCTTEFDIAYYARIKSIDNS